MASAPSREWTDKLHVAVEQLATKKRDLDHAVEEIQIQNRELIGTVQQEHMRYNNELLSAVRDEHERLLFKLDKVKQEQRDNLEQHRQWLETFLSGQQVSLLGSLESKLEQLQPAQLSKLAAAVSHPTPFVSSESAGSMPITAQPSAIGQESASRYEITMGVSKPQSQLSIQFRENDDVTEIPRNQTGSLQTSPSAAAKRDASWMTRGLSGMYTRSFYTDESGTPSNEGNQAIQKIHKDRLERAHRQHTFWRRLLNWLPKDSGSSRFADFVEGDKFQGFCSVLIVANTITIGYQTDQIARNAFKEPPEKDPAWLKHVSRTFTILFCVELVIRFCALRVNFFIGKSWPWNYFDLFLVSTSVIDEIVSALNFSFFRMIKVFRMGRAVRIIRVFRFVRELRLMVCSVLASFLSLLWAFFFASDHHVFIWYCILSGCGNTCPG